MYIFLCLNFFSYKNKTCFAIFYSLFSLTKSRDGITRLIRLYLTLQLRRATKHQRSYLAATPTATEEGGLARFSRANTSSNSCTASRISAARTSTKYIPKKYTNTHLFSSGCHCQQLPPTDKSCLCCTSARCLFFCLPFSASIAALTRRAWGVRLVRAGRYTYVHVPIHPSRNGENRFGPHLCHAGYLQ